MVRANSSDKDLMGSLVEYVSATGRNFPIEYDSKPREYYQHKIGLEGIVGRNFNIALRNAATGAFNDVGNVIAIESDSRSYGTEIALGATVILQQTFGLSSMHELGPMAKFSPDIA
ncbi:MAG: hypothetical protein QG650_968 [Patescibacteria group bacterium]|nr:hypothetical protein [Patescibacteria group bacterium]